MSKKFIIEHLDPELFDWCFLEYQHISEIVGKENAIFTKIQEEDREKLSPFGEVHTKNVKELGLQNGCILDPYAKEQLKPEDKKKFEYFIFGGILGNNPAQKRTELLTKQLDFPTRNLGEKQMSTDTAVFVTKKVLEGRKLKDFHFVDQLEIEVQEGESVELPYRYVVEDKKVILSDKLVEHIRKHGFE